MKPASNHRQGGFTILELMVATAIFLVICAAMFGLLQMSQEKYATESQLSGAFQETRLAIDQIVRDYSISGFPSSSIFSVLPANPGTYAISPVAWQPNYPAAQCFVGTAGGGTCATPGDFDLIIETNLGDGNGVSWVRYQLGGPNGTTLYRAVVPKTAGTDPVSATSAAGVMTPFLTNVMNNIMNTPLAAQLPQITAAYPSMFPAGAPQPIFQYTCDTPAGLQPCPVAGASGIPSDIRDVDIRLIVMTRQPDMQNQLPKLVELSGRGQRLNPSN